MSTKLHIPFALASALVALLARPGHPVAKSEGHESPSGCVSATIQDIVLDADVSVDEIRVQLAKNSPSDGSLELTVESGDSSRVLSVGDEAFKAVTFAPALEGKNYRISLLPDLEESGEACVELVELRERGVSIASIRP